MTVQGTDVEMVDAETPAKQTDSKSGKKAVIIFLSCCGHSNISLLLAHGLN